MGVGLLVETSTDTCSSAPGLSGSRFSLGHKVLSTNEKVNLDVYDWETC